MTHKVHYGEYTLQHWIDLMLSEDIVMPGYQRSFVWEKDMVKKMIENLKKDYFVPPIIICQYVKDGRSQNFILDGQQRLTSVLLSKLGVFPDKTKFTNLEEIKDENDDDVDDIDDDDDGLEEVGTLDDDDTYKAICDWQYKKMIEGQRTIEGVKKVLKSKKEWYLDVDYQVDEQFFKSHYLGFCYIQPKADIQPNEQMEYYSTLFRNINEQGVALSPQESRESLYFMDESKTQFFNPDFIKPINIKTKKGVTHVDFARYLALLSDLKKNSVNRVATGVKKDFEPYYEEYIDAVVRDLDSLKFGKFSSIFPSTELSQRTERLKQSIADLSMRAKTYNSIIVLDVDFFGLVYHVLFEGRQIDMTRKAQLRADLDNKANKFKKSRKHSKNPAGLIYLRIRIKDSLSIYKKYLV
ncbi:MAG: DUF262 domain-containing protein [Prevotella sp.]|nr:DUF262 domain-containing protein [Prevotella sp.]